jgi:hypothetical protein
MRCKRRSLRTCRQRGSARGYSKSEFQKVTAFHDIFLRTWRVMPGDFDRVEMNGR